MKHAFDAEAQSAASEKSGMPDLERAELEALPRQDWSRTQGSPAWKALTKLAETIRKLKDQ